MIIHPIASAPEALRDVLLWDVGEEEWRVGHLRFMRDIEQDYWIACSCREAAELITDGEPVPVFAEVSHWTPMPPKMGAGL